MRLCLYCKYLSIYPSMDLSMYGFIYELLYLSVRLSIYLSKDLLACKHTATSVSFVLDVSRFNSTLSSPRPSWSASVGRCLRLTRTGLTTATTKTLTTKKNFRQTTCNSKTFQKCLPTMCFTTVQCAPQARFLSVPQQNHLERLCRNFAYLLLPENFLEAS